MSYPSSGWRDVKVFLPPRTDGAAWIPPPSEDPQPTPEELTTAFTCSLSGRNGKDAPLMTRAMREKEAAKNPKKTWDSVRIRIRFSDRTQLEATLSAEANVKTLYELVRSALSQEVRGERFTLFQTPPRMDCNEEEKRTVRQLGFLPAAVLSVKWQEAGLNRTSVKAPLRKELLQSAQDLPPPPNFEAPTPVAVAESSTRAAAMSKPMPKWLKGIVKKESQ